MKFFFLAGSFNQGGAEYQLLALANLMQEKGHEVHILAITDYDFFKQFLVKRNLSFECLSNDFNSFKRVWIVSRRIRQFNPDVIISFMKIPALVSIIAKEISFVRSKLLLCERTALIKPFRDFFHFSFWHLADIVATNSVSKLRYLKEKFPYLSKRVYLVSNVYDKQITNLSFDSIQKHSTTSHFNFVYIGRISPEKNLHVLIDAIKLIVNQNIDCTLSIYGDNRNEKYFKRLLYLVETLNLKDRVLFKGPLPHDELRKVYLSTDLLCLLSEYEGFSNVIAEGLIHGCIVLASNIPENASVVVDGENGFLVDTKQYDSIIEGLKRFFMLSPSQILEMRKKNFYKAQNLFDSDLVYERYINLILSK